MKNTKMKTIVCLLIFLAPTIVENVLSECELGIDYYDYHLDNGRTVPQMRFEEMSSVWMHNRFAVSLFNRAPIDGHGLDSDEVWSNAKKCEENGQIRYQVPALHWANHYNSLTSDNRRLSFDRFIAFKSAQFSKATLNTEKCSIGSKSVINPTVNIERVLHAPGEPYSLKCKTCSQRAARESTVKAFWAFNMRNPLLDFNEQSGRVYPNVNSLQWGRTSVARLLHGLVEHTGTHLKATEPGYSMIPQYFGPTVTYSEFDTDDNPDVRKANTIQTPAHIDRGRMYKTSKVLGLVSGVDKWLTNWGRHERPHPDTAVPDTPHHVTFEPVFKYRFVFAGERKGDRLMMDPDPLGIGEFNMLTNAQTFACVEHRNGRLIRPDNYVMVDTLAPRYIAMRASKEIYKIRTFGPESQLKTVKKNEDPDEYKLNHAHPTYYCDLTLTHVSARNRQSMADFNLMLDTRREPWSCCSACCVDGDQLCLDNRHSYRRRRSFCVIRKIDPTKPVSVPHNEETMTTVANGTTVPVDCDSGEYDGGSASVACQWRYLDHLMSAEPYRSSGVECFSTLLQSNKLEWVNHIISKRLLSRYASDKNAIGLSIQTEQCTREEMVCDENHKSCTRIPEAHDDEHTADSTAWQRCLIVPECVQARDNYVQAYIKKTIDGGFKISITPFAVKGEVKEQKVAPGEPHMFVCTDDKFDKINHVQWKIADRPVVVWNWNLFRDWTIIDYQRKLASSDFTIIEEMTHGDVFEAPSLVYPSQSKFIVVPDLSRGKYDRKTVECQLGSAAKRVIKFVMSPANLWDRLSTPTVIMMAMIFTITGMCCCLGTLNVARKYRLKRRKKEMREARLATLIRREKRRRRRERKWMRMAEAEEELQKLYAEKKARRKNEQK